MNLIIKTFDELTTKELYKVLKARSAVFVVEQNCVYQDLDDVDYESIHVFYEEEGKILAYLRLFKKKDEKNVAQLGRILTIQRGAGLGWKILQEGISAAWNRLWCSNIYIEAQCYAIPFYEKAGFQVTSEEFLEDGIPHVQMRADKTNHKISGKR